MKKNWKLLPSKSSAGFEDRMSTDLEPIVEEILFHRGLTTKPKIQQFLSPDFEKDLPDPFLLSDMEKAVQRVQTAIKGKERICIYGDYDADGVTSTVLLMDLFRQLALDVFCYIPERNREGYGMNNEALQYIKEKGASLVITVDCGISNSDEVEFAKGLGMDVVILDHHHVPETIPSALAVVNPKKPGDPYPEKELAGVGVAFKFAQALISREKSYNQSQVKWFLDLVAIGTIADCVPLIGENRTLAKFGLIVISRTKRVGIRQLCQVGRISIDEHNLPTSHHVAFQIAPRINAAGRIDHANTAYQLLIASPEESAEARVLALEVEGKNQHRQKVTSVITQEVERRISQKGQIPRIIMETDPNWELGVIGLAAGKIAEKYHRPTILLHKGDDILKGSGRSIKSFNLIEALEKMKNYLEKYGGHRQAAGLSIKEEKYEEFKRGMEKELENLSPDDLEKTIEIDAELLFSQINEKLVNQLQLFEPFGQENRQPIFFSRNILVHDWRLVGNGSKHLKLWLKDPEGGNQIIEAICFGVEERGCNARTGHRLNVVYNLEEDTWNGRRKIQLKVIDMEIAD